MKANSVQNRFAVCAVVGVPPETLQKMVKDETSRAVTHDQYLELVGDCPGETVKGVIFLLPGITPTRAMY